MIRFQFHWKRVERISNIVKWCWNAARVGRLHKLDNTEVINVQTIKTSVVVVLLMVILYGAFVAMNGHETELPPDLQNMVAFEPDFTMDSTAPAADSTGPAVLPTSTPSGSVFDAWPGATAAAPASTPTIDAPANVDPKPTTTPQLLIPPTTDELAIDEAAEEGPKVSSVSTTKEVATPEQTPAPNTSGDPWIKTLQNSVAGSTAPKDTTKPADAPAFTVPPVATESDTDSKTEQTDSTDQASEAAPKGSSEFSITSQSFENAKTRALENIEQQKLKEGLQTLSLFYNSPELTSEQRSDLLDMLDALAFEVIYSRRHLLDLPYVVAPGEKLADIARMHEVPLEILAKINGVADVDNVMPGTKLKVIKGPFRAEVSLKDKEITAFLGDLYAGRFPISTGSDPEPREGVFQIVEKQRDRNYYGSGGLQIAGSDPRNPYGGYWLDLGQQLSIHGSAVNPTPDNAKLGCVSLSPLDAEDIFTMLSRGCQVTIKR
jgi:hypothetical protein